MKAQHWLIALIVFFTCHTVVSANDVFDNLTQDEGLAAIKAVDDLGFEVLSRAELESVRGGEAFPLAFVSFAASIGFDAIFNEGKGTIRTVALIYQRFGNPGFVKELERKGLL